jgi:hypothetical protein
MVMSFGNRPTQSSALFKIGGEDSDCVNDRRGHFYSGGSGGAAVIKNRKAYIVNGELFTLRRSAYR